MSNNVLNAPEEPLGVEVQDPRDILNNISYNGETVNDENVSEETTTTEEDNVEHIDESQTEIVNENEISEPPVDEAPSFKKIATARLIYDGSNTTYKFDIYYRGDSDSKGVIEFRNIVNAFEDIRPDKENDLKDFFAMYGIIKWNFPRPSTPVNTNVHLALVKIESLINDQIKIAKIKKGLFEFWIDNIDEEAEK